MRTAALFLLVCTLFCDASACVTYNQSKGTYTVDENGSVKKEIDDSKIFEENGCSMDRCRDRNRAKDICREKKKKSKNMSD